MKKISGPRSPWRDIIRKLTTRDLCKVVAGGDGIPPDDAALTYDPYRKFKF